MSEKKLTVEQWAEWLERQRQAFYLGCRIDPYSAQVTEFVEGCQYYLRKEFGMELPHDRGLHHGKAFTETGYVEDCPRCDELRRCP